jgi:hypothetical protein
MTCSEKLPALDPPSSGRGAAEGGPQRGAFTAGRALRNELLNKLTPVLELSDSIKDSGTRLMIQASCLDALISLEEIIEAFELDARGTESVA